MLAEKIVILKQNTFSAHPQITHRGLSQYFTNLDALAENPDLHFAHKCIIFALQERRLYRMWYDLLFKCLIISMYFSGNSKKYT